RWGIRKRSYIDRSGIPAHTSGVVGAHAIEVARVRAQASHTAVQCIAYVQILKATHETIERITGRHIQTIARRSAAGAPVGCKAAADYIRRRSSRRCRWRAHRGSKVYAEITKSIAVGT